MSAAGGERLARTTPAPTETEVDGQVCVYAPTVQELLVLNETASAIWRATAGPTTTGALVSTVATEFGVAPDAVREDVLLTLERFLRAGLLVLLP